MQGLVKVCMEELKLRFPAIINDGLVTLYDESPSSYVRIR